jgi:hypothetical protein
MGGMSLHASRHARKFSSLRLGAMIENGCGTDNDGTGNDWNAIKGESVPETGRSKY